MHHPNDVNDTMNDAIIDHQQKIKLFLYDIHYRYIYLHFVLGIQAGYDRYFWGAPSL